MSTVDNSRPPYVVFERRSVEDRAASHAAGHYVGRDVDMAIITRPGSRDNLEQEAATWIAGLRKKAQDGQIPADWHRGFSEAYKAWQEGETLPEAGTPIKGWPILSPAAQKELISMGIRTVEDLAALPDSELQGVGIGAVANRQKAVAWLQAASGVGKVAEQLAAQATQIAELVALTQAQAQEIAALRAKMPEPAPEAETPRDSKTRKF